MLGDDHHGTSWQKGNCALIPVSEFSRAVRLLGHKVLVPYSRHTDPVMSTPKDKKGLIVGELKAYGAAPCRGGEGTAVGYANGFDAGRRRDPSALLAVVRRGEFEPAHGSDT